MYNEYEDYMRSVLGYPSNQTMLYDTYNDSYNNDMNYFPYRAHATNDDFDEKRYENLYPEIYRILKPMVNKICQNMSIGDVSEERLDAMTNEIYTNIEADMDVINVNIKTEQLPVNKMQRSMKVTEQVPETETRACCKNAALGDLIKILLLQQLTSNCNNKPGGCKPFPPRPPRPPRPPMPLHYFY